MTYYSISRVTKSLLYLYCITLLSVVFTTPISAQNSKITLSALKDITVNCENMVNILPAKPYAKTTCTKRAGFKYTFSEQIVGNCPKVISRVWKVTDSCGTTATAMQKITMIDKTPPSLFNIPSNITLSCGNIPPFSNLVTAKDKCDAKPIITVKDTKFDEKCLYNYKIRREYTAKDACGNVVTKTQIIVIKDDKAPIFTSKAVDLTVSCSEIPSIPKPTATDNCSKESEIIITMKETKTSNGCKDNYLIKRIWTAQDNCGLTSTMVQNIYVKDIEKPVFDSKPSDVTLECGELFTTPSALTAKDNCDNQVDIILKTTRKDGLCQSSFLLIREWTAFDNCNNKATITQTLTVNDTKAPTFSPNLVDMTINCAEISLPSSNTLVTDNCDKAPKISFTDEKSGENCNYKIIRTYKATDNCGNAATKTINISITDKQSPVLVDVPSDVTIRDCISSPPVPTTVKATDNCDRNPTIIFKEKVVLDSINKCEKRILREWTATDACGNSKVKTQIIVIKDLVAPVFTSPILDLTVNCGAIPALVNPTVTDNCDGKVTTSVKESIELINCNQVVKRVFVATDACGNSSTKIQNILVIDTEKPVFAKIPLDLTLECGKNPALPNVVATDNCDKNPTIFFTEKVIEKTNTNLCETKVVRTWVATDLCGNSTSASQIISISDFTAPVFVNVKDVTVECTDFDQIKKPFATDNCTDLIKYTFSDEKITDEASACRYTVKRTWSATDLCGNIGTSVQNIRVQDSKAPFALIFPKDVTLNCPSDSATLPTVIFKDACCTNIDVSFSQTIVFEKNGVKTDTNFQVTQRVWTATDCCGNATKIVQYVSKPIFDTAAPIFLTAGVKDAYHLTCKSTDWQEILINPTPLKAFDACSSDVLITHQDEKIIEYCGKNAYLILRTWTAVDESGNTAQFQQSIEVVDHTAPIIFNAPKDITLSCGETVPPVPNNIFAIDECSINAVSDTIQVGFHQTEVLGGDCPNGIRRIKRYWVAVDSCDNKMTTIQNITFVKDSISKTASKISKSSDETASFSEKNTIQGDDKLLVYPNPSKGKVYISLVEKTDELLIINELGQIKERIEKPNIGILSLDLHDYQNGIYIIRTQSNHRIKQQKLVLSVE